MYIKEMKLDELRREGDVVVSDGTFDILCFTDLLPKEYHVGSEFQEPISCFGGEANVVVSEKNEFALTKIENDYYAYSACGKVIDVEKGLLCLGDIIIEKGEHSLPGDIKKGQYVEFDVWRFDVMLEPKPHPIKEKFKKILNKFIKIYDKYLISTICILVGLLPLISSLIIKTDLANNNILKTISVILGWLPAIFMSITPYISITIWHLFSLVAIIISFRQWQKEEIKFRLFILILIINIVWFPFGLETATSILAMQ